MLALTATPGDDLKVNNNTIQVQCALIPRVKYSMILVSYLEITYLCNKKIMVILVEDLFMQ